MDAAAFRALIQRLEKSAALRPAVFRVRVAGLAVLGYTYILGMLVVLVVVTTLLVMSLRALALKLAIPLVVVIGATLKALWVKVPPPDGLPVSPNSAPPLFEMVREVARRLRAPRVHAVLAVPELTPASCRSRGWACSVGCNYLLIGLPLLQAVPPEEWRAILAHEMGHLSGSHGRFGAWIYRVRATWGRLLEQLEARQSGIGKFLFGRFVGWFAPYFNAYTFVLARAQEYEADAASAELVGAETARQALSRIRSSPARPTASGAACTARSTRPSRHPTPSANCDLRAAARADTAAWMSAAWRRPPITPCIPHWRTG
jgi:Zn-dependent protease with chaperone function